MEQTSVQASQTRLVATCFGLAVAGIIAGGAILLILGVILFVLLGLSSTPLNQLVLSLVAIQGLGFPLVAVLYFRYTGRSLRSFVPVKVEYSLTEVGRSLEIIVEDFVEWKQEYVEYVEGLEDGLGRDSSG